MHRCHEGRGQRLVQRLNCPQGLIFSATIYYRSQPGRDALMRTMHDRGRGRGHGHVRGNQEERRGRLGGGEAVDVGKPAAVWGPSDRSGVGLLANSLFQLNPAVTTVSTCALRARCRRTRYVGLCCYVSLCKRNAEVRIHHRRAAKVPKSPPLPWPQWDTRNGNTAQHSR